MPAPPSVLAPRLVVGCILVLGVLTLGGLAVWWSLPVEATWHMLIVSEGGGGHDVHVGGTLVGPTPLELSPDEVARLSDPTLGSAGLGATGSGGSTSSPQLELASRATRPVRAGAPWVIVVDAVWADGRSEHYALAVKVTDATGRELEVGPCEFGSGRVGKKLRQRVKWTFVPP